MLVWYFSGMNCSGAATFVLECSYYAAFESKPLDTVFLKFMPEKDCLNSLGSKVRCMADLIVFYCFGVKYSTVENPGDTKLFTAAGATCPGTIYSDDLGVAELSIRWFFADNVLKLI